VGLGGSVGAFPAFTARRVLQANLRDDQQTADIASLAGGDERGAQGFGRETSRHLRAGRPTGPERRLHVPAPEQEQGPRADSDDGVQAAGLVRLAGGRRAGETRSEPTDVSPRRERVRGFDAPQATARTRREQKGACWAKGTVERIVDARKMRDTAAGSRDTWRAESETLTAWPLRAPGFGPTALSVLTPTSAAGLSPLAVVRAGFQYVARLDA
jgi:hypothetical protein